MRIADIIQELEYWAPRSWQESYDNSGLLVGDANLECTGILCALDATEEIISEAIEKGCNLVVAHHPIIFGGVKRIDPGHYVGRSIIRAIRHDIAIFAIHTNLDNKIEGVNKAMADRLELVNQSLLAPKSGHLKKLYTYVPEKYADTVVDELFRSGAGQIGQYDQCSFRQLGVGSFRPLEGSEPFVGQTGSRQQESEWKLEVLYPAHLEREILEALKRSHPYEEVAFDLVQLSNTHPQIGSGLIGELPEALSTPDFLDRVKTAFGAGVLRFAGPQSGSIRRVALCGGAGSFLISKALAARADAFLTADLKYHEFFDANGEMLLVDLGHYESEQFTIGLIQSFLAEKFLNFAILKTERISNPVRYH